MISEQESLPDAETRTLRRIIDEKKQGVDKISSKKEILSESR